MKRILTFLLFLTLFTSCKNESKKAVSVDSDPEQSEVKELSGNFIYYEDSAVFQTKSELYGVVLNEKLEQLISESAALKSQPAEDVFVTLKVKVSKNTEDKETWENWIEIQEIISVIKKVQKDSEII